MARLSEPTAVRHVVESKWEGVREFDPNPRGDAPAHFIVYVPNGVGGVNRVLSIPWPLTAGRVATWPEGPLHRPRLRRATTPGKTQGTIAPSA